MSEKRFVGEDGEIIDTKNWTYFSLQDAIDLLNKQETRILTMEEYCEILKNDNENLKQRLDILREEIQSTVYILKMQTRKLEGY